MKMFSSLITTLCIVAVLCFAIAVTQTVKYLITRSENNTLNGIIDNNNKYIVELNKDVAYHQQRYMSSQDSLIVIQNMYDKSENDKLTLSADYQIAVDANRTLQNTIFEKAKEIGVLNERNTTKDSIIIKLNQTLMDYKANKQNTMDSTTSISDGNVTSTQLFEHPLTPEQADETPTKQVNKKAPRKVVKKHS